MNTPCAVRQTTSCIALQNSFSLALPWRYYRPVERSAFVFFKKIQNQNSNLFSLLFDQRQRFYESLRQSSERTIKKISNKDFSLRESTKDYSAARSEKLGSFVEQQRSQGGGGGGGDAAASSVLNVSH